MLPCLLAFSQYGNEWINFGLPYFKLKIAEDGLYRVTAAELEAQGFQTNVVSAERLKLYHNGQEIAILMSSSAGNLNYFEFYGKKNDGQLDTELYVNSDAQPHSLHSLFADTSTYFLTYELTGETGKRMAFSTDNDNDGLTAEAYHFKNDLVLQSNSYAAGLQFGIDNKFSLSQYDYGEGWTGSAISKGSSQDFEFLLSNTVRSGPNPTLEMVLIGQNSLQHVVDIQVGPDTDNLRTVSSETFSNRNSHRFTLDLEWSDISADDELVVRANVVGLAGVADRVSISFVNLAYPQSLSLNSGETNNFHLEPRAGNRSYLSISSNAPSDPRFFDITEPSEPIRLNSNALTSSIDVVVNGASTSREILAITSPKSVPSLSAYSFREIDLTNANYLIISHPELRKPSSTSDNDPVQSYADYRSSVAGGEWSVEIANIEDIYDQFFYGVPSPLAIRRLARWGYEIGQLEQVFLVGKGTTVNFNYYRNRNVVHFLPTYGLPGSDLLFTTGFDDDPLAPSIGIGRITARQPDDVQAYLDKVEESESVPFDALWKKNILQLTGGQNPTELNLFQSYAEGFSQIARGDFLGAQAQSVSKETTATVEFINIREEVDNGLGMITFFGHSGSAVTDIEVDQPSVYENKGRYPAMFLVNGCNAGEIFATGTSFGEPWILTRDRGSTGFIAHADFALSSGLRTYTDLFYTISFSDSETYGSPIGDIMVEVAKRYFDSQTSTLAQSQVYQMVLQGDPATKMFAAPNPDFAISDADITASAIVGDKILASQDSFRIEFVVENYGKSTADSLAVKVTHTLPNGNEVAYDHLFPGTAYRDTLEIFIANNQGTSLEGTNTIDITLDPLDSIAELSTSNNQATIDVFVSSGSTLHLSPLNHGLESSEEVRFIWQVVGKGNNEGTFDFEVDTTTDFTSPFLMSSVETGDLIAERNLNLSTLSDSTVVYWRTRLSEPERLEDTLWNTSDFTLIRNTSTGWAQYQPSQFLEGTTTGINYQAALDEWVFQQNSSGIEVQAFGINAGLAYGDIIVETEGVDLITTSNLPDPFCRGNTINAVVFDRQTSNPYLPIQFSTVGTSNALVCGRLPQLIHNFTQNDLLGSSRWLERLIDEMESGDQLLLFSIDSIAFSNWDDQLKSKLTEIGLAGSTLNGLTNGQPVIFFGTKGDAEGTAKTVLTDNTGRDPTEQVLRFVGTATGQLSEGTIRSPIIGPATGWNNFSFDLGIDGGDNFSVNVIGIGAGNQETSLFTSGRTDETIDLSAVDASTYPSIRLDFNFTDGNRFTPPQPRFWQVEYEYPPDGILILPDESPVNLQEGDSVRREFYFYNYSGSSFEDSVTFSTQFRNIENGETLVFESTLPGPGSGDTTIFNLVESTFGNVGTHNLTTRAFPREQELYASNNNVTSASFLTVESDNLNPILDVTFDGTYILNGDLVSPRPFINILLQDQNPILKKSDTTGVSVYLRTGDEGEFVRIPFTNPEINYSVATNDEDFSIQYEPGPLEDGRYALRVEATDESGNAVATEPYEITFEVINESSVTHFYPYPNPFSTSTRFVFTLTGSVIPDEIKIQIMTVTGRVVREILQDEIGPLRIGNNITQYAWDGRDEFGDQLANGVYLYRVITRANGEHIKNRGTAADRAFKNGFGKLYILR